MRERERGGHYNMHLGTITHNRRIVWQSSETRGKNSSQTAYFFPPIVLKKKVTGETETNICILNTN